MSSEFSILCCLNCDFYDPHNCQVGIHYHKKAVEADDSVKICQSSLRSGNLKTWYFGYEGRWVSFDSILLFNQSISVNKPQGEKICIFELKFQANWLVVQPANLCTGYPTDNMLQTISDDLWTILRSESFNRFATSRLNFNTDPTLRRGGIINR